MKRNVWQPLFWLAAALFSLACQPIQPQPNVAQPAPAVITIEHTDARINAPTEMTGGVVTIHFQDSRSQPTPAEPQLARLAEGKTLADYQEAVSLDLVAAAQMITALGGVFGINHFVLAQGNYLALRAGPPTEGPPPLAAITVTGKNAITLPTADVEVALQDFSFAMPAEIPAGKQLWHFVNQGKQWHHLLIWQRNEGVTHEQFMAWLMTPPGTEPAGPPPMQWVTGWAAMDAGQEGWAELDLAPGEYEIVCFLPDFSTNPPKGHLELGMHRLLVVK
jgi:hypothetical protein